MKRLKVDEKKALWESLVKKHYNHEFPKLYRIQFNKHGVVKVDKSGIGNVAWAYAQKHFPTLCRMFESELERIEKGGER